MTARTRLTNRAGALLATLGINGYDVRRADCRARLAALQGLGGAPIPPCARAKLERLIARYELVLQQIKELEAERDRVLKEERPSNAEAMIQKLCTLKGLVHKPRPCWCARASSATSAIAVHWGPMPA